MRSSDLEFWRRTITLVRGKVGAVFIAAIFCPGCQSKPEDNSRLGVYQVNERQTAFYRYGPAQSFGPDFNLAMGQRVVVLKYENAFSRVMSEDGISGYVSTDALKAAPPPPPQKKAKRWASAELPSSRGSSRSLSGGSKKGKQSGPSSANSAIIESGPLFEPDLPVLPEETATKPD